MDRQEGNYQGLLKLKWPREEADRVTPVICKRSIRLVVVVELTPISSESPGKGCARAVARARAHLLSSTAYQHPPLRARGQEKGC